MNKSATKKISALRQKFLHMNGYVEFFVVFLAAAIIAYVLANLFREEVYDFVVNVIGL